MTSPLLSHDLLQTRSRRASAARWRLVCAAWLICSAAPALAAWGPDPQPVDLEAGDHAVSSVVPDGSGGVYVVWQHYDGIANHVRVQHLDANGDPVAGWSVGGAEIATSGSTLQVAGAGTDAAGGLLVGWGEFTVAKAKRVAPDGSTPPGWGANGNVLWSIGRDEQFSYFGADGTGGAWSVLMDTLDVCPDVCHQVITEDVNHVDAAGTVSGDLGTLGSSEYHSFNFPRFLGASRAGGLLSAVVAPGGGLTADVTRSFPPTGPQWHTSLGSNDSNVGGVADDGAGGALLVTAGVVFPQVPPHVLRLDATGAPAAGWPAGGIPFRTPQVAMGGVLGTSDGANGILIGWAEGPGTVFRLQRITGAATLATGWPADGVLVNSAPGAHTDLMIAADGAGGAWVAWRDHRSDPNGDVYATHVKGDGQLDPAFPVNGIGVAKHPYREFMSVASVAPGVAVIAWQERDYPSSPRHLVYVQRLPLIGPLSSPPVAAGSLELAGFRPNPARGAFQVTFTLPAAGDATLDVFDLVGRLVFHDDRHALPAGSNSIRLTPAASWRPGVYLVRLRAAGGERTARGLYLR